MATHESYFPVSTVTDPQMTCAEYEYAVIASQQMFPPGLPTPASVRRLFYLRKRPQLTDVQGPYSQLEFPPGSFMAPEATMAELNGAIMPTHTQLGLNISAVQPFETVLPARPHSSPSTFGPNEQDLVWADMQQQMHGLEHHGQMFSAQNNGYVAAAPRHRYSLSSTSNSDIKNPQPRRPYPTIAPSPIVVPGPQALKRSASDMVADDDANSSDNAPTKKRRRPTPPPINATSPELSDEDRLLLRLKDEEHVSWKDIAARFHSELGKTYQVPALQMRLKRLRERLRVWTETDVSALRMAHEFWERNKFEIIATKVRSAVPHNTCRSIANSASIDARVRRDRQVVPSSMRPQVAGSQRRRGRLRDAVRPHSRLQLHVEPHRGADAHLRGAAVRRTAAAVRPSGRARALMFSTYPLLHAFMLFVTIGVRGPRRAFSLLQSRL